MRRGQERSLRWRFGGTSEIVDCGSRVGVMFLLLRYVISQAGPLFWLNGDGSIPPPKKICAGRDEAAVGFELSLLIVFLRSLLCRGQNQIVRFPDQYPNSSVLYDGGLDEGGVLDLPMR